MPGHFQMKSTGWACPRSRGWGLLDERPKAAVGARSGHSRVVVLARLLLWLLLAVAPTAAIAQGEPTPLEHHEVIEREYQRLHAVGAAHRVMQVLERGQTANGAGDGKELVEPPMRHVPSGSGMREVAFRQTSPSPPTLPASAFLTGIVQRQRHARGVVVGVGEQRDGGLDRAGERRAGDHGLRLPLPGVVGVTNRFHREPCAGHEKAATTLKYAHLSDVTVREAFETLSPVLSGRQA